MQVRNSIPSVVHSRELLVILSPKELNRVKKMRNISRWIYAAPVTCLDLVPSRVRLQFIGFGSFLALLPFARSPTRLLERNLGSEVSVRNIGRKVVINQLFFSPLLTSFFFVYINVCNHYMEGPAVVQQHSVNALKRDFIPVCKCRSSLFALLTY